MQIVKNGLLSRIPVRLLDAAGAEVTGKVTGDFTITVSKNGTSGAGGGAITEIGNGNYYYTPASGETDTNGFLLIRFAVAGSVTFMAESQVAPGLPGVVEQWKGAVPVDLQTGWVVADMPFDANNFIAFYLQTILDMIGPSGTLAALAGATRNTVTIAYFGTPPAPADLFKGMSIAHSPDLQSVFGPGRVGQLRSIVSSTAEAANKVTLTVTPDWLEIPVTGTTLIVVYASGNVNQKLGSQDMVLYRRVSGQLVKVDDISIVQS